MFVDDPVKCKRRDAKDASEVPDACKSNAPNDPRVTMQDVQQLVSDINAFRQKTAYPYNPAVATAASNADNTKSVDQGKSLKEIAQEKENAAAATTAAAAAAVEGETEKEESTDKSEPPVDDMTKLALQNIDSITITHKTEHPTPSTPAPSQGILDSKRSLNTTTEGVHAFEISLNNCFGLLHVHKVR